ncbi:MAG: hypothetical protein HOM25_05495 [Rhodospirillaceae bacterium]|jgi:hypothetical protein|nr:hypothetical protein [Rhodospirillaceae bacterium]MBT5666037.1 hypothetical protein [Rhodospirillaceae bacterium]MBT5809518.1 hypothetical protein [Rhodospirillaceae bacterium]
MHRSTLQIAAVPILFAIAAMGVQSAALAQSPRINWAAPEEGMLINALPEFPAANQRRVVFTDRWQHEEYALFQGGGAQSEMILSIANERDIIALDYALTVRRNIETWNINRNNSIQYGRSGRVESRLGTYFYEHYALSGANRNCVGYYTTWDEHVEDYQGRPAKAVFGYYCAAPGDKITTAKVNGIVDSIDFRAAYDYARFEPTPPKMAVVGVAGQSAAAFAKGSNANAGNANFPFDMAVLIDEVEGEDRRN